MDGAVSRIYKTIYADPPWDESGGGEICRGAQKHYPLMKTREICALPVAPLAAKNAHLYLWVTNNYLQDGFEVMDAWGFRYITLITWAKDKIGLGQYYRGQTEHCMFGVRGNLPYRTHLDDAGKERRNQGRTLLRAERTVHSRKPEQMRVAIEHVSYPPYLELFARGGSPGWDVWGNEAENSIEMPTGFENQSSLFAASEPSTHGGGETAGNKELPPPKEPEIFDPEERL
jgi:N6-adenosine-specific RNA methylase IME4